VGGSAVSGGAALRYWVVRNRNVDSLLVFPKFNAVGSSVLGHQGVLNHMEARRAQEGLVLFELSDGDAEEGAVEGNSYLLC